MGGPPAGRNFAYMDGAKAAFQYAEKRAPFRVGVANTHHLGASAHDTGVNRPFIWRRFHATQIVTIEVEHDEPIQRRTARAYAGYGKKSFGSGNAHAYVAETVGDAFAIENVTTIDQFLLEFFEFAGIESGYA